MCKLKTGDWAVPNPMWNRSEQPKRHLANPTKILEVKEQRGCQSGTMCKVITKGGTIIWLDSDWFMGKTAE